MRTSRLPSGPRLCRSVVTLGLLPLLTVGVLLVISAPAEAKRADETPPTFAGLKSATTCIPGPIGGGRTAAYDLKWDAAMDDVSPSKKIVYDVYQANTSGGEDFTNPNYTTSAGATSFRTPPLPTDRDFYFVVRARDKAGNSDSNKVEREGQNLCV